MNTNNIGWQLLSVRPNCYKIAENNLLQQNFGVFSPKYKLTKRKRGQFHNITQPLFPGYLFAEVTENSGKLKALSSTKGVSGIISFTKHYSPLQPSIIENLRNHCDENNVFHHDTGFRKGDEIEIINGPFSSLIAKVDSLKPNLRVLVLFEILGNIVKTELSTSDISSKLRK